MSEIDLGSEVIFNVKVGTQSYKLREPTFHDIESMADEKDNDAFIVFLFNLGLPKEVARGLSLSKLKKLEEGLIGEYGKK